MKAEAGLTSAEAEASAVIKLNADAAPDGKCTLNSLDVTAGMVANAG